MTSLAITSAGTTVSVGTAPGTYNLAGFQGVSYTAIGEIVNIPAFGKEYNLVTHNPVGDRATYKLKGSFNNGSVELEMAKAESDAGQVILQTALGSDSDYAFKVQINGTGQIYYFPAKVMSFTTNVGSVDSIYSANVMLEISGEIYF